jgi:hypothetical protein
MGTSVASRAAWRGKQEVTSTVCKPPATVFAPGVRGSDDWSLLLAGDSDRWTGPQGSVQSSPRASSW